MRAWPRLLGWPGRINWLFSPVTGNTRYPGDLWGIDSHGDVLIVETKVDRNRRGQDPFKDFVPYAKTLAASPQYITSTSLARRWERLLKAERQFQQDYQERRLRWRPTKATHPGVLPYSSHRDTVWRWHTLYSHRIVPILAGNQYERAVRRSFTFREAAGNPPPYFIGLVATVHGTDPDLSAKGITSLTNLQAEVGAQRVVFRALRITSGPKRLRIHSWSPPTS